MTPASGSPDLVPRGGQGSLRERGREAGRGHHLPAGREASLEEGHKPSSWHTQSLCTWEPDTPCWKSSSTNRLQPAYYSAAAWGSLRGSNSLHKETSPRPGCTFYPGNLPRASSYARCQDSRVGLCAGRRGWLAELLQVGDLRLIPSPFPLHQIPLRIPRVSPPESPGWTNGDKNGDSHMELCSMLYGSLDGRGGGGRMDTCLLLLLLFSRQVGPTLPNLVDCSIPGFPVPHHLPEFAQVHVHWIDNDTCIGVTESFCCPPETITTLLIGSVNIANTK